MAASLSLSSYNASLGTTITATASGLTIGTMYEITVSTSSSSKYWRATSSSSTWSFTPTTTGYTTFYLYEAGKQVASRSVMITSGGGSGGGGDSGGEEEEEYASPPSIYSVTAVNGTYADNILKFEFEANLRNPNSDTLYARYQCKFGNGSTTYYAPYYDGSGTKPSRGLSPGIRNYMKCFSTSYNSVISYAYHPSTTAPGTYTATIPVYISLYYAEFLNDTSVTQTAFLNKQFNVQVQYTISKNNIYFNGTSPLTTSLRGTPVNESILATQWNKFCENISGMSSYGNKSTDDIIKQTEVQRMLTQLGSSTTVGKQCLIDYFIEIEDLYNS